MDEKLCEKLDLASWIARSFFDRGLSSGTSGNLSFLHEGVMYITASGSSFGLMCPERFAAVTLDGETRNDVKASKEWVLHAEMYKNNPQTGAVIHLHSPSATLWSCLKHENEADCIPTYTPYLKMKLGTVGIVPYAKPGSAELVQALKDRVGTSDGWLLSNHGSLVPGKTLMDAFTAADELEDACRLAWQLRGQDAKMI